MEDAQRPRFRCRAVHEAAHAPFLGFNRAQAAVVEAAILVSRLHMLPRREGRAASWRYLQIAIDKTAGAAEREAWGWLMEAVAAAGIDAAGRSSATRARRGPSGAPAGRASTALTCSPSGASQKLPQVASQERQRRRDGQDELHRRSRPDRSDGRARGAAAWRAQAGRGLRRSSMSMICAMP